MVLLINTVYFPADKAAEVGKKYIEVLKKYPPDRSIAKTISVGVKTTIKGIKVLGISDVKKGKLEEAYQRLTESSLMYASIEGFKYKIEVRQDVT